MNANGDKALSKLYRSAATGEPSAALDRRILEAAREAAKPAAPRRRPWWSGWLAPVGLAATVVVSVTVMLLAERDTTDLMPASTLPPVPAAAPAEPPAGSAAPAEAGPLPAKRAVAPSAKLPPAPPAEPRLQEQASRAAEASAHPVTAAPPPPALLRGAPASVLQLDTAPAAAVSAPAAPQPSAKAERQRLDAALRPPDDWLEDIRQLKRQGRTDAARQQLAAFRRAYPDHPVPDDLVD